MSNKEIVVRLKGGLGNQMFQYAFARALSKDPTRDVIIDGLTGFRGDFYARSYSLDCFAISNSVTLLGVNPISRFRPLVYLTGLKIKRLIQPQYYIKEKTLLYDKAMNTIDGSRYLDGYWQSDKYFIESVDEIRKDFQFRHKVPEELNSTIEKISKSNSIAIHIRNMHGTTFNGKKDDAAIDLHGGYKMDYLQKSLSFIKLNVENPVFFVFSDDPKWARENLGNNKEFIIIDNSSNLPDYEDLRLMALCKHNIIANSSFSWWGAWLNRNPDKIVIAPKIWYDDENSNGQTTDLIPKSWIRI